MPFNSALKSPDAQGYVVRVEEVVPMLMSGSASGSEPPEICLLKALRLPSQLAFQACFGLCRVKIKGRPGVTPTAVSVLPAPTDALEQDHIPAVPAYLRLLLPISGCHAALALSAEMEAVAGMAGKILTTAPQPRVGQGLSSVRLFG